MRSRAARSAALGHGSDRRGRAGGQSRAATCDEVLESLARQACRIMRVERAVVVLRDEADPRSSIVVARPRGATRLRRRRIGIDEGMAGRVITTGEPVLVDDYAQFPQRIWHPAAATACVPAAAVPIRRDGIVLGALAAGTTAPRAGASAAGARDALAARRAGRRGARAGADARGARAGRRERASRRWRRPSTCATTTPARTPTRSCGSRGRSASAWGCATRQLARARVRRPPARRRQDRRARRGAAQGRAAGGRRVGDHAPAPGLGSATCSAACPVSSGVVADRAPRARALGRRRLSRPAAHARTSRSRAGSSSPATRITR